MVYSTFEVAHNKFYSLRKFKKYLYIESLVLYNLRLDYFFKALLSKGDIILEVNGISVDSPEELITEIAKSKDTVTLKIAPSFEDTTAITGVQNGKVANGYGPSGINTMVSN